jgi:hypothetical protein
MTVKRGWDGKKAGRSRGSRQGQGGKDERVQSVPRGQMWNNVEEVRVGAGIMRTARQSPCWRWGGPRRSCDLMRTVRLGKHSTQLCAEDMEGGVLRLRMATEPF